MKIRAGDNPSGNHTPPRIVTMKEKDEHRRQPAGGGRDQTVPEVDRFYPVGAHLWIHQTVAFDPRNRSFLSGRSLRSISTGKRRGSRIHSVAGST